MTTYLVPDAFGEGEFAEKRSRFLGRVWPVADEAEATAHIEAMRKQHHDARHNVFAYCLRSGAMRYSDDGEPQGTAGQPVLNVFRGADITDFCCVVTRYFGGILLGTGGLTRAYAAAAKLALDAAGVRRMAEWQALRLCLPYGLYDRVRRLLEASEAVVEGTEYGADVTVTALLRADRAAGFSAALTEASAGAVQAEVLGVRFQGVRLE